jgi:hypothetical protein
MSECSTMLGISERDDESRPDDQQKEDARPQPERVISQAVSAQTYRKERRNYDHKPAYDDGANLSKVCRTYLAATGEADQCAEPDEDPGNLSECNEEVSVLDHC